jgi:transposase
MVGVSRVEIHEAPETLKALMHDQKTVEAKERLQALYLIKSGTASSVGHAAQILGRHRITLQRWLSKYTQGGLETLLKPPTGQGCPSKVPEAIAVELKAKLDTENGFSGYGDVQDWLLERGVELTYGGTHYYVHDVLGAGLKVPRPRSLGQDPVRVDLFKKTLPMS